MVDWTFRPATADDVYRIADLKVLGIREHVERLHPWSEEAARTYLHARYVPENARIIEVAGRFAGCVALRQAEESLWIEQFYLHPDFQGRGLGGAVLAALLEECDAVGAAATAGETLGEDHMRFLQEGMFGWGQRVDRADALARIVDTRLVERFHAALDVSQALQRDAIAQVRAFVRGSRAFADCCNDDIGNVCLLRVSPDVFGGTDVELFDLLARHGVAVLPGNAFGLPIARGEATFRMTLIHEPVASLVRRLERVDEVLVAQCPPRPAREQPAARRRVSAAAVSAGAVP